MPELIPEHELVTTPVSLLESVQQLLLVITSEPEHLSMQQPVPKSTQQIILDSFQNRTLVILLVTIPLLMLVTTLVPLVVSTLVVLLVTMQATS
mgnify:FL=1